LSSLPMILEHTSAVLRSSFARVYQDSNADAAAPSIEGREGEWEGGRMGGREGEWEGGRERGRNGARKGGREGGGREGGRERRESKRRNGPRRQAGTTRAKPKIKQLFDRVFERQQEQLCADAPPRPAT